MKKYVITVLIHSDGDMYVLYYDRAARSFVSDIFESSFYDSKDDAAVNLNDAIETLPVEINVILDDFITTIDFGDKALVDAPKLKYLLWTPDDTNQKFNEEDDFLFIKGGNNDIVFQTSSPISYDSIRNDDRFLFTDEDIKTLPKWAQGAVKIEVEEEK